MLFPLLLFRCGKARCCKKKVRFQGGKIGNKGKEGGCCCYYYSFSFFREIASSQTLCICLRRKKIGLEPPTKKKCTGIHNSFSGREKKKKSRETAASKRYEIFSEIGSKEEEEEKIIFALLCGVCGGFFCTKKMQNAK